MCVLVWVGLWVCVGVCVWVLMKGKTVTKRGGKVVEKRMYLWNTKNTKQCEFGDKAQRKEKGENIFLFISYSVSSGFVFAHFEIYLK